MPGGLGGGLLLFGGGPISGGSTGSNPVFDPALLLLLGHTTSPVSTPTMIDHGLLLLFGRNGTPFFTAQTIDPGLLLLFGRNTKPLVPQTIDPALLLSFGRNGFPVAPPASIDAAFLLLFGRNGVPVTAPTRLDAGLLLLLSSTIPVPLPYGLLEGLRLAFTADTTAVSMFNALHFDESPEGATTPNLVVTSITSVPTFHTGSAYFEVESLSFTTWSKTPELARKSAEQIKRSFDRLPILMADGTAVTLFRTRQMIDGSVHRGSKATRMYRAVVDFDAYTSKSLTSR